MLLLNAPELKGQRNIASRLFAARIREQQRIYWRDIRPFPSLGTAGDGKERGARKAGEEEADSVRILSDIAWVHAYSI